MSNTEKIIYYIFFIAIIISSIFAIFHMIKQNNIKSNISSIPNNNYSTQQMYTTYTLPHNKPYTCNQNNENYTIKYGPTIYHSLPFTKHRKSRKNIRSLFSPTEDEIKTDGLHYKIK